MEATVKLQKNIPEKASRDEMADAWKNRPPAKTGWRAEVDLPVEIHVIFRVAIETGIKLPENIVSSGGFDDVEKFVNVILGHSLCIWNEMPRQKGETVS
ncbi:MAG: hypothetical protein OXE85_15990 [Roseovarius sp.]|nr:hypothetical protein [Roseovarius sp.]MCY4315311.1 hypothetical protein [Roseovarius sp.]